MDNPIAMGIEGTRVLKEPSMFPKPTGLGNMEVVRDGVQSHEECKPPPILDLVFGRIKCLEGNSVSLFLILLPYPGL